MTDILKICTISVGSLKKAYAILPEHITNLGQKPQVIPITTLPTLLPTYVEPDAKQYDMQFDRDTSYWNEKKNITERHGDFYTSALGFQVKKLRPEVDYVIEIMANAPVHILFEDNNGLVKFMTFARLTDEANTGDKKTAKNGYTFSFTKRAQRKTPSIPNYSLGDVAGSGGTLPGDGIAARFNLFEADGGAVKTLNVYNSGRTTIS